MLVTQAVNALGYFIIAPSELGQYPSPGLLYCRQRVLNDLLSTGKSSCWYTAHSSLGMTLISANTLAFGLIGKDRPHRIKKICFENMNLIFGSAVVLLRFLGIHVWNSRNSVLVLFCRLATRERTGSILSLDLLGRG
jgi:hypothetical protein